MIKTRYLVFLIAFLCANKAQAQVPSWGGGADLKDISFGFGFQYISSDFKIFKTADWRTPYFDAGSNKNVTDSLSSISSTGTQGFGVGFVARYRITDNLEIRTTPSLTFTDRTLVYQYINSTTAVNKQVNASLAEFPLSLKIKSDRIVDFRAYLLGGVKYSYGISKTAAQDPNLSPLDRVVVSQRGYASYEVGIGMDIYFEYFKFSPEFKISNSLGNVLTPNNDPYSKPLEKLMLHSLVFTIYFE
jgi:hypothetical protein